MFVKQREATLEWAENHESMFDDRAVIVMGLYVLGLMAFDVVSWKAIAFGAAAYALTVVRIAPRPVGVLGVAIFFAAMARWTDIAGINELAETAHQSLIHLALH
jgi:hypothetical protein